MKFTNFHEQRFRASVDKALGSVQRVLETSRNPHLAEDVDHSYDNKYDLADHLTNTAIIAKMNVLEQMGLTTDILGSVDTSKSTTLRFQAFETCEFLKEQTVDVPSPVSVETTEETDTTGTFFGKTKKSSIKKVVAHVKEFHWKVGVSWELSLYSGTDVNSKKVLKSRSATGTIIRSNTKDPPCRDQISHPPIELSLIWFLKMINTTSLTTTFQINTQDEETKTPRRNKDIDDALQFMTTLRHWSNQIQRHFTFHVERGIIMKHNPAVEDPSASNVVSLNHASSVDVFCPALPLMEEDKPEEDTEKEGYRRSTLSGATELGSREPPILSRKDMHLFLNEQIRTLNATKDDLGKSFPAAEADSFISVEEATLTLLCRHANDLVVSYEEGVNYIENMLKKQLIAAIGKELKSDDLDQFVKFHNAKLLKPPPVPFCHAIRRPHHYPEGLLSIECSNAESKMEPIETLMRAVQTPEPLEVPINAATTLEFTGPKCLHGWVQHRFESDQRKNHQLIARARQFSSFILVVGTMIGPNRLDPKDAIILQNKDEVIIPLLLEELPTPKEFKDAIRSLSPEQQRFAKAFRNMQLESSVFGVCIVQIKPQLETLLRLPPDALTKEMKLTQDLMELFIEHQVPSDLLSYDGPEDSINIRDKVESVKGNVKAVLDVVEKAKTKQLEGAAMRADMAIEQAAANAVDYPVMDNLYGAPPEESSMQSRTFSARRLVPQRQAMPRAGMAFSAASAPAPPLGQAMRAPPPPPSAPMTAMSFLSAPAPPKQMMVQKLSSMTMNRESVAKVPTMESSALATTEEPNPSVCSRQEKVEQQGATDSFTLIPKLLDESMGLHDKGNALRSTIVKTSNAWTRKRQENLLTKVKESNLSSENIKSEKNMAFDLMDALSRSGSLPIACTELHVVVSVTHRFENDLMGTVVQDNVNPVEKLEKSTLLVASTIHGVPARSLVADPSDLSRLTGSFPELLSDQPDNDTTAD